MQRNSVQYVDRVTIKRERYINMDKEHSYRTPLVYQRADPFVLFRDGKYYFTGSIPQYDCIELRCADTLDGLAFANSRIVWKKNAAGPMSAHVWAPEIHFIGGKWYIYFTTNAEDDIWSIRPFALFCEGNPMEDEWHFAGRIDVGHDSFSLDMTSFFMDNRLYSAWAQTVNPEIGSEIFIAEMETPTSLKSRAVSITRPEFDWEKQGFKVNEGPAFLHRNGKVIMTYSASDTGFRYCMGMLWADEKADLLNPMSWHKSEKPVFSTDFERGQYGPGHNCFTTDGEHDVMVYHCRNYKDIDGDPLYDPNRHAKAVRFTYDENGLPVFGRPAADNQL